MHSLDHHLNYSAHQKHSRCKRFTKNFSRSFRWFLSVQRLGLYRSTYRRLVDSDLALISQRWLHHSFYSGFCSLLQNHQAFSIVAGAREYGRIRTYSFHRFCKRIAFNNSSAAQTPHFAKCACCSRGFRQARYVSALVEVAFCQSQNGKCNIPTAGQQGAAPDRLQPALVPRSGFRRRVSLVVRRLRAASM